jgi:hypothetical protein
MFDKLSKNDFSLAFKPKNLFLPLEIRSSNLKKKVIPSCGYSINTMD